MSTTSSPELWLISPPDTSSGFLFIATHTYDQLDNLTRLLTENEFLLALSLCDENSRFHVKDDCGVVYRSCLSDDGLPFIGGSIIPYLSKRKLIGRIALPTFFLGITFVIVMVFLAIVMLSASIALVFGNVDLALVIGSSYSSLIQILLILVGPFLLFAGPLYLVQRKYKEILSELKSELKEVLLDTFSNHETHEVDAAYHVLSRQVPLMLSELIEQFSESIPDVTHEQLKEYDTPEYT